MRDKTVMIDVVEAILLRCVVKDLLRHKIVCKSWYSLISTPAFAKTHVKFISNKEEEKDSTRKIAMITSYIDRKASSWGVPKEWKAYYRFSMQGSCNGLVCLCYSLVTPRICVTNPVTKEYRHIEQPRTEHLNDKLCLGFGYDSSSDDYKLVLATCQSGTDTTLVRIFSFKSDIWKDFGQVKYRFIDLGLAVPGILFNGALHWLWNRDDSTLNKVVLVSFDLAREKFTEIPQPNDKRYVWNIGHKLGIIQGRLCIFPAWDPEFCPSCGIWVMKSYNSWELFPNASEMMKDHAIHYMLKDSDEYRRTPPQTYFCDENTRLSRSKEHIPSPMFVPSLVSPYANCVFDHEKNNKIAANAGNNVQEEREIAKVYSVEDRKKEIKIIMRHLELQWGN